MAWPPGRLLFALTFLSYFNAIPNGFVLDDWAFIHDAGNIADVPVSRLLLDSYHGFYRPFAFLILRFFVAVFGAAPAPYHILNFCLYYMICRLVYRIVRKLSACRHTALLTAVLYTVHPVHHPLVSNCFTLCLNVYVLTGLGSLWFFIRYLDKGKRRDAALSVILFAASLLSHLSAVALPLVMLAVARFRIKITGPDILRHLWPYIAVLAVIVALRTAVPGTRGLASVLVLDIAPAQYLAVLWDLLCWYHGQLLVPWRNIFLWDVPLHPAHAGLKSFNFIISGIGILYLLLSRWRSTERGMWLAVHLSGLLTLPVAAFIYAPQTGTAIIEPLWYGLTSIGIYALAAHGLVQLKGRIPAKSFNGLVVGLTVALIFLTLGHNTKWRDERTYTRYWISVNPRNPVPWQRWALTYLRENREEDLRKELNGLAEYLHRRHDPLAWRNRGHLYRRLMVPGKAIADYTRALVQRPDDIEALLSRAGCYALTGDLAQAQADLSRILSIDPLHPFAKEDLNRIQAHLQTRP